ncbi:uncharacterized protein G2W53_014037 [Senna tora]|uniref:Uncharacterized protein n=1 Tax=Senna tora TaxID=362788 RepID=A0A834U4X5_9FABA|nr:uncharacterized protein G2W53_014037 [Senna tora]
MEIGLAEHAEVQVNREKRVRKKPMWARDYV